MERVKCLLLVNLRVHCMQNSIILLLCLPGGLRGPSNLPIPPTGGGGALAPFGADGGGIFNDPEFICLYSAGIRGPPLSIIILIVRVVMSMNVCEDQADELSRPRLEVGDCVAWRSGCLRIIR
jgi:hypothetical protein